MHKEEKKLIAKVCTLVVALGFFGVLFGAPLGVMGWSHHLIDFLLKTKIILAFSIFGFGVLFLLVWWSIDGKREADSDSSGRYLAVILVLMYSISWSWLYQDCTIFNFCERPNSEAACHADYDKSGAFLDCE